jgi:hypothetical protein
MASPFPHVYRGLSGLRLESRNENSTLRFHLTFRSSSRSSPLSRDLSVQFDVSAGDAMAILAALQTVQRKRGWRVPDYRPRGKPNLKIVSDD